MRMRTRISPRRAKIRVIKFSPETKDGFPCGWGKYALGVILDCARMAERSGRAQ